MFIMLGAIMILAMHAGFAFLELGTVREKNQVKEVKNGLECGISLKDFIDFKEKDIIEAYLSEKIDRQI